MLDSKKQLSENIKKLRKKYNLSQSEFGKILNVSDKAVSSWEKGTKTPRIETIQKISEFFKVPSDSLINTYPQNSNSNKDFFENTKEQILKNELCNIIQNADFDEATLAQLKIIISTFIK